MENIHTVEQLKKFIDDELRAGGKGINDVYQEVINYIRDYNSPVNHAILTQFDNALISHTHGVKNGD